MEVTTHCSSDVVVVLEGEVRAVDLDCESDGVSRQHSLVLVEAMEHTGMQGLQGIDGASVAGEVGGVEGRGRCGGVL